MQKRTAVAVLALTLCSTLALGADLRGGGGLDRGLPSTLDVAVHINSPRDSEDPGLVQVQMRLINMGTLPATVPVLHVTIVPSGYADSVRNLTVDVGGDRVVDMYTWVCPPYSEQTCTAWITYPADTNHANDTAVVIVHTGPFPGVCEDAEPGVGPRSGQFSGGIARARHALVLKQGTEVTLYDIEGCRVAVPRTTGAGKQCLLELRYLRSGVYLVRLDDGRSAVTRKLVVQR